VTIDVEILPVGAELGIGSVDDNWSVEFRRTGLRVGSQWVAKPLNLRDLYVRASISGNSLTDEIRRYLDVDEMHLPATSREMPQSDGLSDELAAYPKAPAAIFGVNTSNSEASFEHVCGPNPRGGSGMVDANACRTHEWHSRNLSPPNGSRPIMRCFKGISCLALPHLRRASKSMLFADQLACPGSHNDSRGSSLPSGHDRRQLQSRCPQSNGHDFFRRAGC